VTAALSRAAQAPAVPPALMGVVNVTPDSFFDGGRYFDPARAIAHGAALAGAGADIVDIGGESTRPGAAPVAAAEELRRVLPVVEGLAAKVKAPLSIDTSKPEVMAAAVAAGAVMINDVRALQSPGALAAAAGCGVPVVLMHMQGEPATMQHAPRYGDVVAEVTAFLKARRDAAITAGVDPGNIYVDPGFGFGKTPAHNIALLANIKTIATVAPVVAGLSNKSIIRHILGAVDAAALTAASAQLAAAAAANGAAIIRVHDVTATRRALAMQRAISGVHTIAA